MDRNRFGWALGVLFCGACSEGGDRAAADATPSTSSTPHTAAAPADVRAAGSSAGAAAPSDEDDDDVPAEKFEGGERAFAKVRETLLQNYYADGIREDDLYRAATAGMLQKVEPRMKKWNQLLSPRELAEMRNDLRGEVVGVGVVIEFEDRSGYADVLATIPGSPSEKAGLVTGDKIVTVNGKLYRGMSLKDVVADIRGKAGESVELTVLRGDKLIRVPIRRERVTYDQPSGMDLDGVGYLRIPSFTDKTPAAVRATLETLAKASAKALVVDLRECPGGSFERAVETADLLFAPGTPLVTLKRRGKAEETVVTKGTPVLGAVPVAVLVGHETASGCEILASALQEGRHALLVGQKTLGKWSVQSLDELPNGYAFKYTVSLFKTPSGRSFEGVGLAPDVEVAMDRSAVSRASGVTKPEERLAKDVQLRTARGLLQRAP